MAQQTQMSRVLPKYREFIANFPAVDALATASAGDVLRAWAPLGYNMRALRLHKAAQRIAIEGFPRGSAELAQIDGIGPFTAAIVASFAFGEAVAAVDTNVRRVVERLDGSSNCASDELADTLLSRRAPARWNQAMMDLGALVCTARNPSCDACPLARWCITVGAHGMRPNRRIAERRAEYGVDVLPPTQRRYYRGRIVQALRELPAGRSISKAALRTHLKHPDPIPQRLLAELLAALERDGLLHVTARGRVRLP
jgi:A/G-specific adenine glycosylase